MQPDLSDLVHEHSDRCWWDLHEARWACPPPVRAVVPLQALPTELAETVESPGRLVGAGSDLA